jgi:hypothetical protein
MFWSLAQSQVFKSYWDDAPTFVPKATMPECPVPVEAFRFWFRVMVDTP